MNRQKEIIRTSMIGIAANAALAAFKAFAGILSHSIAITLDAVNNLSDALSSVITIIGTKLAGKKPDPKHPYGYGRIEYMSALIISVIVLYAGITSLTESIKKIITPETPDYSTVTLVIVVVGILTKIILGRYVKASGIRLDSDSLQNSGDDALNDAMISATTLIAALLYIFFHISAEAYLGAVISIVIIKSGIDMLKDTISRILGERGEGELAMQIKKTISSFEEVHGAYDLVMHDYGPENVMASVHIEVKDTMKASEIDVLTRQIVDKVYQENHVVITGISIYSLNTQTPEIREIEEDVRKTVMSHDYVLQVHGFFVDIKERDMRFDVVVDLAAGDVQKVYDTVSEAVRAKYPDYRIRITLDTNVSD